VYVGGRATRRTGEPRTPRSRGTRDLFRTKCQPGGTAPTCDGAGPARGMRSWRERRLRGQSHRGESQAFCGADAPPHRRRFAGLGAQWEGPKACSGLLGGQGGGWKELERGVRLQRRRQRKRIVGSGGPTGGLVTAFAKAGPRTIRGQDSLLGFTKTYRNAASTRNKAISGCNAFRGGGTLGSSEGPVVSAGNGQPRLCAPQEQAPVFLGRGFYDEFGGLSARTGGGKKTQAPARGARADLRPVARRQLQ